MPVQIPWGTPDARGVDRNNFVWGLGWTTHDPDKFRWLVEREDGIYTLFEWVPYGDNVSWHWKARGITDDELTVYAWLIEHKHPVITGGNDEEPSAASG